MLRCYSRKILAQLTLLLLLLRQAFIVTSNTYESSKISRDKRHLVFPLANDPLSTKIQLIFGIGIPMEDFASTIVGLVQKINYNLPTNGSDLIEPYTRYVRSNDNLETDLNSQGAPFSRYDLYKMITNAVDGFLGKACLLRIICEFAEIPLSKESGIVAELLHSLITPSTTVERMHEPADQEYLAAEMLGRSRLPGQCKTSFPECDSNILEYFTEIRSHQHGLYE